MSRPRFLSPDECAAEVALASPLAAVGPALRDVSGLGKLEIHGEVAGIEAADGEELLPLDPGRVLLVCEGGTRAARERLAAAGYRVYDMTAGLAAFDVDGEAVLRRLTELDLDTLPTTGSVGHGISALIERRGGETFRLFVPRELGQSLADITADIVDGLGR
jgi:sarcosine oxidase gamma subunit